ncbi:hypothetical protein NL676_034187 [Syzygium grande]|nr:hypothetical protein NL676_034187 [Syzygium grande]
MANQAEIAAMIDEKLKEHMNTINEQIAAAMSKMMSDLMAKQQWIHAASQSEIPPLTRQGLRLDKALTPVRSQMLVMAAQFFSQLIAIGEEIESELKKGWYSESGSSGKRFTSKKDKEHVPKVNMTYVQKAPAHAPKLQFSTQQTTPYKRQGQTGPMPKNANLTSFTPFRTLSRNLGSAKEEELAKFRATKI